VPILRVMQHVRAALATDKLTWFSRALSLTGLAISAYLTVVYLRHQGPICFGGSRGCLTVEQSRYARIDGVPLPIFGLAGYTMLFVSACIRGQRARAAGVLLAGIAIAASACLTYLELNVIHAVCYWCVASATCATAHVFVNSARFIRGEPNVGDRRPGILVRVAHD
jgi:uncharacterized membrane protein